MNERIKELYNTVVGDDKLNFDSYLAEKFAELIVKECCEVAHCNFHVDGLTLGGILKEHFAVKE